MKQKNLIQFNDIFITWIYFMNLECDSYMLNL